MYGDARLTRDDVLTGPPDRRRRSACAARRSRTTTAATDTTWQYLPDGAGGRHPLPHARRPRRDQRARRGPLLQRDPRRPRLGPLDGPVHGDGPGRGHGGGAGRRQPDVDPRDVDVGRPSRSACAPTAPILELASRPAAGPRHERRPDRPRRHRPVGDGRDLRPRAPRHRRRTAGPDGSRTSTCPTSTGWRPSWRPRPTSAWAPSSMRCPATPAATRRSWPSCRAGRASTSSPRPACTTTATTGRPTGGTGCPVDELADLFVADIERGHRRQRLRGPDRPSDDASGGRHQGRRARAVDRRTCDRPTFEAAAAAHRRTGAPILTHCEGGTGALEQVRAAAGPRRRPGARRAEPRRQGRRPRLPPGARRDRRGRRVRRVVPLGRRRQRHAPGS